MKMGTPEQNERARGLEMYLSEAFENFPEEISSSEVAAVLLKFIAVLLSGELIGFDTAHSDEVSGFCDTIYSELVQYYEDILNKYLCGLN